ncbi:transposon Ty3-I Gag-Pol polyprotein, partial [Nephila pilipes]
TRIKSKNDQLPIAWTQETKFAFDICKKLIIDGTLLSFVSPDTRMSLMVDGSGFEVEMSLQQHLGPAFKRLEFSKEFSATERRYSSFYRENLSKYLSVKHFRCMLDGHDVIT